MAQQVSPYLEAAYGWNFGEGGWNSGMDQNLLKFSFLFDRNVDSVTASLPAAVNGQAHYLTTDNRLYFAVGTTYFSTPVPKWFTVIVRSTGQTHQFDGVSLVQTDTPVQLDSRIDAVELTVSTLGTAAFESVEFFATQAELDVAAATAASYTDTLRNDIAETANINKGASLVGFDGTTLNQQIKSKISHVVDSIATLKTLDKTKYTRAFATGYYGAGDGGGGPYYLDVADTTSLDNGGTIIVAADGGRWKLLVTDAISVKQFGAKGDGVADDGVSIQNAINSRTSGLSLFFPAGTYRITSELTVVNSGVSLVGENRWSTLIRQDTLTSKIINNTAPFTHVSALSFMYNGLPSIGATAIYSSGNYSHFNDFIVRSCHTGVHLKDGVAQKLLNFEVFDYESVGVVAETLNDAFISKFIINAGNDTRGALGGIRLIDKTEAVVVSDGDILLGQYSMTMVAAVYGLGTRPAYNNFTNVFFDSAAKPTQVNQCIETEFVGCWFSGGRSGGGEPGVQVSTSESIRFVSCRFFNNGSAGIVVASTSSAVTLIGCDANSNSTTSGSGVAHGIVFSDGTNRFKVIGCTAGNGLFNGTQGYGLFIGAGCSNYSVRDNDFTGNATGAILDGASSTTGTVHGNIGYITSNQGNATVDVGQTVAVVNHGLPATPVASDISLTFTSPPGTSGVTSVYATGVTSTQFQIATNATVSTQPLNVGWAIRIKGA